MTRTVKKCARISIVESGQYNFKECPLVGPQDNVKNSLGVILVSPFKILMQVTKSIFTRLTSRDSKYNTESRST